MDIKFKNMDKNIEFFYISKYFIYGIQCRTRRHAHALPRAYKINVFDDVKYNCEPARDK